MVQEPVPVERGHHTQRNGQDHSETDADQNQFECGRQFFTHDFRDIAMLDKRHSQLSPGNALDIIDVLNGNRSIESHLPAHLFDIFLFGHGTQDQADGIPGDQPHQHKHHDGHPDYDQ